MVKVERVKLGSQGLEVSKQGLGCMGLSAFYGTRKAEDEMIALIHHAVDSGVTFLDTSDAYGPYTNEILIGKAINGIRHKVEVASKFAFQAGSGKIRIRGDPEHVRAACEASLARLNVDYIDLYYQHRVDTTVPIEITIGAMKELVEEGKIKYIGLSEACAADIRRAHAVHPITAVQLEWSLWTRDIEEEIVPTCRELGIGIVSYSPLGRGFFSGKAILEEIQDGDFRKTLPRFLPGNVERNRVLYEKLVELGTAKNATSGQLALAWLHKQGDDVVPIPGTTQIKNFDENVGALGLVLSEDELHEIEVAVPLEEVQGTRYLADQGLATYEHAKSPPLDSWVGERNT